MKKTFSVLLILFSAIAFCQSYQGTLTYKDGSQKKGLLDPISKITKNEELAYKENEKASKQKLSLRNAVKIEYNDNGNIAVAEPIIYRGQTIWLYKIHEGKIIAYANSEVEKNNYWSQGNLYTQTTDITYYFFKYKDQPAEMVSMFMDAGPLTINTFQKSGNTKILLKYFENKCPKVADAYKKGEIKIKKDPYPFVDYFEKNCN